MDADYYTGEYDYTPVDRSQPETPTETTGQGQVTFFPDKNEGLHFLSMSTRSDRKCLYPGHYLQVLGKHGMKT